MRAAAGTGGTASSSRNTGQAGLDGLLRGPLRIRIKKNISHPEVDNGRVREPVAAYEVQGRRIRAEDLFRPAPGSLPPDPLRIVRLVDPRPIDRMQRKCRQPELVIRKGRSPAPGAGFDARFIRVSFIGNAFGDKSPIRRFL